MATRPGRTTQQTNRQMKYFIFSLCFLAAALSFTACDPIDMDMNADVEYYIEFSKTDVLDQLELNFSGARAHQTTLDGQEALRTVYLSNEPITIDFNQGLTSIALGVSDIEAGSVSAYDLLWDKLSASLNGEPLNISYDNLSTHEIELRFAAGEDRRITFKVDLESSLEKRSDGSYLFTPVIEIVESK